MRQSTTPTATDAATISSSAADIIHQEPPTLDSPGTISATSADAGQGESAPATVPADQQQDTPERRTRRKDTTSAAAHNRYMDKVYDRLNLQIVKGDKSRLQAAAAALDMSPTALIIAAVNAYTGTETLTPKARNPYI